MQITVDEVVEAALDCCGSGQDKVSSEKGERVSEP